MPNEERDRDWFGGGGGRRRRFVELRARALREVREFFAEQGFLEIDAPTLVPSPGLDTHLSAFEVRDAAGGPVGYLATSPEYQLKRLLSAGFERIYTLGKVYRADEQGPLHEAEFTLLEWYRVGASSAQLMQDTEALVARLQATLPAEPVVDLDANWARLSVSEAFARFAGQDALTLAREDQETFFRVFVDEVEPGLRQSGALFLTDWPAQMASLAQLKSRSIADRFEGFVNGVELCNGFGELTDPVEQRARFERDLQTRRAQGLPTYPIDERFLQALSDGLPACAGNALGVDRLLMLLLGAKCIQDVMPFPWARL